MGHWKFTNHLGTHLSFPEPQSRLCTHCCQMWGAKKPALPKGLLGVSLMFSLYCNTQWDFYSFISLYLCVVRESLLEEFTNGGNTCFNNLVAKLSVLMIQETMCVFSCPLSFYLVILIHSLNFCKISFPDYRLTSPYCRV